MDVAIIDRTEEEEAANPQLADLSEIYHKVDEIPFDFSRRRLSTVVEDKNGKRQMITKGAVDEMLSVCSFAEYKEQIQPLTDDLRKEIMATVNSLNENGMRVIAIAQKEALPTVDTYSVRDEGEMVLMGYLAFLDPPKKSTADALRALKEHGVTTKILTGDNDRVTRCICKQVGMKVSNLLLGSDVERMSDDELIQAAETTDVFAKLSPDQKARVVSALRSNGHTVGFMGDGINDAAAMKSADIGISVDTAVDIAKESADIILLDVYKRQEYYRSLPEKAEKLDELPFDYDRKCVSILLSVQDKGNYIITKGDVDSVYSRCRYVCHHDQVIEVDPSDSGGVHTVVDEMLEDCLLYTSWLFLPVLLRKNSTAPGRSRATSSPT